MTTQPGSGPSASTLSCPCGASIEVDLGQGSQETVCPECGQVLEVVVNVDKKTQRTQVGILVKPGALAPKKKVKAGAKTEEAHVFKCTCGAQITIVPRGPDTIYTCSACQAEYTATLKQGRTGAVSALVLRPVLAMPVAERPAPTAKAAPAAAPPPTKASPPAGKRGAPAAAPAQKAGKPAPSAAAPGSLAAKEGLLMMAKGDLGAQEVLMNEDVLTITCFCGKDLQLPKMEFHRELVRCVECGLSYRVFAAKNPKNMAPMAIMIPR
jgi:hypothetical protein